MLSSSASSDANARSLHGRGSLAAAAISLSQRSSERARLPAVGERLAHSGDGDYVSRLVPKTDPLGAESS